MITLTLTLILVAHTTLAEFPFDCKDVETHPNLKRLAAPSECGVPADTPAVAVAGRIRGGERVTLGDRPWMVYISMKREENVGVYCGGTLISRNHVLTAAHCLERIKNPKNITVRVGENVLSTDIDCDWTGRCSPPPIDIKVALAIVHEHYDPVTAYNDIALLKLAREVKFNDFVKPICLPTSCELLEEDFTGKTVEAAGWGINDIEVLVKTPLGFSGVGKESKNLMKLSSLKIEDTSKACPTYIKDGLKVTTASSQMCANNIVDPARYKNTCSGDSGGPLTRHINIRGVAKYVQVGITSIGYNCTASSVYEILVGYPQKPSFYTRISWFTFWILEHLSD